MRNDVNEAEHYVKNLIREGENLRLDFKFEISNARKMARTFSAFANTSGGRLLIGVKDNGKISGIRSDEEAYMAESAAHVFSKPAVNFTLRKWVVEGKSVLEITVPESKHKPHFAKDDEGNWVAYVRVADQNIKANSILVKVWKNEGTRRGAWLKYGNEEKTLIDYLTENEKISLPRFIKIAKTNRSRAEAILVNLVLMKVLKMEITEQSVFYSLHPAS